MSRPLPDARTTSAPSAPLENYGTDPHTGWYDRIKTRYVDEMVSSLHPHLPECASILEIGPGHGHFARAIAALGHRYDAIEPSGMFRRALQAQGFKASAEPVPPIEREDGAYDLVYASMVLENLPTSAEAAHFALEARRVLKPTGKLVLVFPDFMTWGSFFFDEHYTHSFVTTPRRVTHLLTTQGFSVERVDPVLGWFWARNTVPRAIARHIANVAMWPMHTRLAYWTFRYLGLGELHWKARKTLFEAIVLTAVPSEPPALEKDDGVSE